MRRLILAVPFFALWTIGQAWAEDAPQTAQGAATTVAGEKGGDPLDLPPDQFFNQDLTVYSPAKKLQKLRNIPSAVYVLTAEDIRRSAAENLIDVFRLVPGIEVARVSAHEWAITSRGFNQVFGNKILLLIDGAPVETPIFNGILWENINIPLDTIERVEFVRGPGAAIWGTRAMNGLINVITKSSFTYPYNRASVGGGNEHLADAYVRSGAVLSDSAAVQTYAKVDKYDGSSDSEGKRLDDNWEIFTANARGDFRPSDSDKLRVVSTLSARQADFQLGVPTLSEPFEEQHHDQRENNRGSLGVLWDRELGNDAQVSVEWTNLLEHRKDFLLDLDAYYSEIELRHRFHPTAGNDLTYGLNFRYYTDHTNGSETLNFDPNDRSLEYYRAFLHDEIALGNEFTLTLGSRFEENDQVGFSAMPTIRLLYSPSDRFSLWSAVSYTTGSPARTFDDLRLNVAAFQEPTTGLPALVQVTGNRSLPSEKLMAYEVGAWAEPLEKLYTSVAGYYFQYHDLAYNSLQDPILSEDPNAGPYLLVPALYTSDLDANSIGGELTADWSVTDWFSVAGSYSHLKLIGRPDSNPNKSLVEDNPRNLFSVRGHFTFSPIEFDTTLRYVDVDRTPGSVFKNYFEGDVRVGWFVKQNLELEIIGRNLFHDRHQEAGALVFDTPPSSVERSVFCRATYTF
ncbi:MAG: TonB-dependent receptor plug domain-containing protein [Bdellovibrionota bacterium]